MKLIQPRRFHPWKALWVISVLLAFAWYTTHRDRPARLWAWTGQTMGAAYSVKIVSRTLDDKRFAEARRVADNVLDLINRKFSTWLADSDVSRFNASTNTTPQAIDSDVANLVRESLRISELSGGAFDITFAPMFDLWGFGPSGPKRVPTEQDLSDVRPYCGYRLLRAVSSNQIAKSHPAARIAFNAIVPGFAADQVASFLVALGHTNIFVEVGGEVIAFGSNLEGKPWRVGVERPQYDQAWGADLETIVHLSGRALATSGDYRNYFKDAEGRVYSHLFDPRLGRPVSGLVASVSVIATNCMTADALSTTLFVLGPEAGLPWLTNFPGCEVLFIMRREDGAFSETASPGFSRYTQPPPS